MSKRKNQITLDKVKLVEAILSESGCEFLTLDEKTVAVRAGNTMEDIWQVNINNIITGFMDGNLNESIYPMEVA